MIGRLPPRLGFVVACDRRQVEFVDHVADEIDQVIVGKPVAKVGRKQ